MKHHVILRGLVLAATVVTTADCRSDAAGAIPFTILEQGAHSGIDDERTVVIHDGPAFATLWAAHTADTVPAPDLPKVDFSKEMVVAAFAGIRNTGGYRLSLVGMEAKDGRLIVSMSLTRPSPGCIVAQAVSQPYVWVKTEKSSLPAEFHVSVTTTPCDAE